MKLRILLHIGAILLGLFSATAGWAQCTLTIPNVTVCGTGDAIPGAGMQLMQGAQNITSQITSVVWTQGANPAGTGQFQVMNPTGTTTYTATVTAANGCTATANVTVNTNGANCPTASFSYSPIPGCDETAVTFNNTSTPTAGSTYFWSFGDGTTSTQQNPTHIYDTPDGTGTSVYNVVLEVTRNGVSTITQQTVIIQQSPPPVSLLNTDQNYCTQDPTATAFINLINLPPTGWTNNFTINWGDGSPNTPVTSGVTFYNHDYPRGAYTMTISFSGPNGCVVSATFPVFVGNNPAITVGNLSGSEVCNNDPLQFSITQVAGNPPGTTYTATFTDGSPSVVFSHPPPSVFTHLFDHSSCGFTTPPPSNLPNAFSLEVVAENPCGVSNGQIQPIRIMEPPTTGFTVAPNPVCINSPVSVTNTAFPGYNISNGVCDQNYGLVWSVSPAAGWTLSSGTLGNFNGQPNNFTQWNDGSSSLGLTFSVSGTYSITQIVGNFCGFDTLVQTVCVVDPLTSDFHLGYTDLCAPELFTTDNLTTPLNGCSPPTYNWSISPFVPFNAPFTSASFEPTWSITNDGTYTITLTATNACGSVTTDTTITLIAPPIISFSSISDGCAPYTVTPSVSVDAGGGNILVQEWSIDGGPWTSVLPPSPIVAPQQTFGAGVHSISVRITNECGTTTATRSFLVSTPPQLILADTTVCAYQLTQLQALLQPGTGTPGYSWSWNATGLDNYFIPNPLYLPANTSSPPATITELLIVTVSDAAGCSDVDTIVATIYPRPGMVASSEVICQGEPPVLLTVSSDIPSTVFTWSPTTDLSVSTGDSVISTSLTSISYTVLGVDTITGCAATVSSNLTVNVLPIVDAGVLPILCAQNIALTLPSGTPFGGVWSDPTPLTGQFTAPDQYIPLNTGGSDQLVYSFTDFNGCTSVDTLVITISNPSASSAGSDTALCLNDPVLPLLQGLPTGGIWSGSGVSLLGGNYVFDPALAGSGLHTLTYTTEPNTTCETSDVMNVLVHALPSVNAGNDVAVCSGDSLWLIGTASGGLAPYQYTWSPGIWVQGSTQDDSLKLQTPLTLVALQQNYQLSLTDDHGCTVNDAVWVTVNPLPLVDAGSSPPLCAQTIPVTLSGYSPTSGGTGIWSGSAGLVGNVFTPSTTPGNVTLYYTFTDLNQCTAVDSLILTINAPVFPDAGVDNGMCVDAPLYTLTPATQAGGQWSGNGVVGNQFNAASAGVGIHTLTYTINAGTSCETSDTRLITVWALPVLNLPATAGICTGETLSLTAAVSSGTTPYTYTWSPAGSLTSANGNALAEFLFTNPGPGTLNPTLSLQISDAHGCLTNGSTSVSVFPLPVVDAGPNSIVCAQPIAFGLTPSPAGGVWELSAQLSGNTYTPSALPGSETLSYTYTDGNGCVNSDSLTLTINAPVFPEIGPDLERCLNAGTLQLQPVSQPGGIWSGTGISASGLFDPLASGDGVFEIIYTINDNTTCETHDTLQFSVWELPQVNLAAATICSGDSILLVPTVSAGLTPYQYLWTSQASLLSPADSTAAHLSAVAPSNPLSFASNLQITDAHQCVVNTPHALQVLPLPVGSAGPDMTVCMSVQTTYGLSGFSPANGTWSGLPGNLGYLTGTQYHTLAPGADTFVYTWTDAAGCTNRDTMQITITSAVAVSAGPDLNSCLSANPIELPLNQPANPPIVFNYYWTGPGVSNYLGSSVFDPAVAGLGTHTLMYVYEIGANCAATDEITVVVADAPVLNTAQLSSCHNQTDTLQLQVSGGLAPYSVQWPMVPGLIPLSGTQAQFTGNNNGPGMLGLSLDVLITDAAACGLEVTVPLQVWPPPVVDAGPSDTLCNLPIPHPLTGFSPVGGSWTGPGLLGNVFTPNALGDVVLSYTFTDVHGCQASDTRTMHITAPEVPSAGPDQTLCISAAPVILQAVSPAGGQWSGAGVSLSAGNYQFNAATAGVGTHALVYTINDGTSCENTDTLRIQVNAAPQLSVGNDTSFCTGPSALLQATVTGGTSPLQYAWSGSAGITGPTNTSSLSIQPSNATAVNQVFTYTLQLTDAIGCVVTDAIQVTVHPLPVVDAGTSLQFCNQPIAQNLGGTPLGGIWSGSPNISGATYTPSQVTTETLTYTYTDANGCTASDNVVLTVSNPQIPDAGSALTLCGNDAPISLTPSTLPGGSWSGTGVVSNASGSQFSPAISGPGTFTLNYTVFAGTACEASDTRAVTVIAAPQVSLPTDLMRCVGAGCEQIAANPAGGTFSGGNYISASGQLCLQSLAPGDYPVYYAYTDPATACTGYDTLLVKINEVPVAGFTTAPFWCSGVLGTLSNTSTLSSGSPTFAWTVTTPSGDLTFNTTSPQLSLDAGTYPVQLIASSQGCHDTTAQTILVVDPPVANFNLSVQQGCAPINVQMTNLSSGYQPQYQWTSGTFYSSTQVNPADIVFPSPVMQDTLYTVQLIASNTCGADTALQTFNAQPMPNAAIAGAVLSGCSPFIPSLNNAGYGSVDSWTWITSDGSTYNTANFPAHAFIAVNNDTTVYSVSLIASNPCGNDTATVQIVALPNLVSAFFNTDPPFGCANLNVLFTNATSGATSWTWNFGDGSPEVNAWDVNHTYTTGGQYTIRMIATDGCSVDTAYAQVTVFPRPDGAFQVLAPAICQGSQLQVENLSSGAAAYLWNFGNGQSSLSFQPDYVYPNPGNYTIQLITFSPVYGCPDTTYGAITVQAVPQPQISPDPQAGCMPLYVNFTNSTLNGTNYQWDFGNGETSQQAQPDVLYTQPGDYTVQFEAENYNAANQLSCSASGALIISVYPKPISAFNFESDTTCGDTALVPVFNLSQGAQGFEWQWQNYTSTEVEPLIMVTDTGNTNIYLIAQNFFGCSDTSSRQYRLIGQPDPRFIPDPPEGCAPLSVQFTATSPYADRWTWNFGDGSTATGSPQVQHVFSSPGSYPVSLNVSHQNRCFADTTVMGAVVVHSSAVAQFSILNEELSEANPVIDLENQSTNAVTYQLDMGDGTLYPGFNPHHIYQSLNPSGYTITLIANNQWDCADTLSKTIDVVPSGLFFVPSAFSPNDDDKNEFFGPQFQDRPVMFEFLVFNRWGELIFRSTDPEKLWDGRYMGRMVEQDVYVFSVQYQMQIGEPPLKRPFIGRVTVLR